jgi:type IV pilus assembly protein PilA
MHSLIRKLKKQQGFTLIELMIVVAIIGILAAVAIPNFIKFQLRSKASEGKINLSSIRTAEESYFAETGSYAAISMVPSTAPLAQKLNWGVSCPSVLTFGTDSGACFIGWEPEGDIYYQYAVNVGSPAVDFFATGESDIDADGNWNVWGIKKPPLTGGEAAMTSTDPSTNGCTDVKNLTDQTGATNLLSQVGPCDSVENGRNVF